MKNENSHGVESGNEARAPSHKLQQCSARLLPSFIVSELSIFRHLYQLSHLVSFTAGAYNLHVRLCVPGYRQGSRNKDL